MACALMLLLLPLSRSLSTAAISSHPHELRRSTITHELHARQLTLSMASTTLTDGGTVQSDRVAATRVHLSHILVDTEELAKVCVAQLEDGILFETLAESVSACESSGRGGDLGWISPGLMVPEVDFVAFLMEPGEARVVRSDLGWHVLRVSEAANVPLEMTPLELKSRLAGAKLEGLQLVDLRDEEERRKAMLPADGAEAEWLPYKEWMAWAAEAVEGRGPLSRGRETVFFDHRGGRAERIAQYLGQNGFTRARFLEGGINAYAEQADARVPVYLESDGDCLTCHEH